MCRKKGNFESGLAIIEYIIIILAVCAVAFVLLAWFGSQLKSGADCAAESLIEHGKESAEVKAKDEVKPETPLQTTEPEAKAEAVPEKKAI